MQFDGWFIGIMSFNNDIFIEVELAWRSRSVMDCHTTDGGSIPSGKGVKSEIHVLRKGQ